MKFFYNIGAWLIFFVCFFRVVYEPMVLTSSCLDNAGKKSVRQQLCILGGHMVNEWSNDCSLVVMNKISVTIKVR